MHVRLRFAFLPVLAAVHLLAGCVAREPPELPVPPPPPRPHILVEENVPPLEKPKVRIVDIKDALSDDQTEFIVTGVLINDGNAPTTSIMLQVEGRDKDENVVATTDGFPSTQVIEPQRTATFTSRLKRQSNIVGYHVEAAIK